MGLISTLRKKIRMDLFTTPSHAQDFFIFPKFRQFYKYDISETDSHNPGEALEGSQKRAGEIYKTKSTHFLTNGSTSGIIAAVLACTGKWEAVKETEVENNYSTIQPFNLSTDTQLTAHSSQLTFSGNVLIWQNSHPCHQNAVRLAGGTPVFFEVEKDKDWGIYGETSPDLIEDKLKTNKIKAVIVTSPTYEGVVSDIAAISEICKKYGAYLIVDEAHGALYPFCEKLPTSAIYLGADFVIQSLHKTAGGLNPTALLHCNLDLKSRLGLPAQQHKTEEIDVESALNIISTTSPSYPLLASIEKNIDFLNSKRGRKHILKLIESIENMKKNLPVCEFYGDDPTKILVKVPNLSGFELSKILFEKYRIEDEICNEKSVMLLTGIGTDLKKLKRLGNALNGLSRN